MESEQNVVKYEIEIEEEVNDMLEKKMIRLTYCANMMTAKDS